MSDEQNPPVRPSDEPGEGTAGDPPPGASGGDLPTESPTSGDGGEETFTKEYVQNLRDEAAEHRVRAKRATDAENRLRNASIREHTAGLLQDPTDLAWSDDLSDEDGWPDAERIKEAADELLKKKPHLGRARGDVGQGRHDEADNSVSLTELLRAGA